MQDQQFYQQFHDPLMEPEELSEGFSLVPEGIQLLEFSSVEVDQDFENSKGVKGWRWTFEVSFPEKSTDSFATIWIDNTSSFGQTMLHNIMLHSGIPYETNPALISTTTGQPRKSFSKAVLRQEIDGTLSINEEAFIGRRFRAPVRWRVQCPECSWGHFNGSKMNSSQCKYKDMSQCYYEDKQKIEADAQNDKIFLDINCAQIQPVGENDHNLAPVEVQQQEQNLQPQPVPSAPAPVAAPQTQVQVSHQTQAPTPQPPPAQPTVQTQPVVNQPVVSNVNTHIPDSGTVIVGGQQYQATPGGLQSSPPPVQPAQSTQIQTPGTMPNLPEAPQLPQMPQVPPPPGAVQANQPTAPPVNTSDDDLPF